ncbi:NAD-dependent succinate-semialdehyde dehydrogenase [Desulforhopalus singaporensis]|uniref:Succinate-semialdehyde dehydrogenase / glutarate-semialdehyde dehydrogenase n=1 Tax=Desulforhopalus singaporensis TaxID=91360 RepID=A0A1H0SWS9_9BACT|nr:NAD-dependent succinate-semialdehyde dehydrogenase [Desulforhopalus singaporensis]SDP46030.1 succinate-semialdehyde dehydrogenase / glutarate-semialdehyde dehydrogenase [Desulforhopalus singaporensis]
MYIDGSWIEAAGRKSFPSINPASGQQLGTVADGGETDAVHAVDAADRAFVSWSRTTAYQRADFLYRAYSIMMAELESLASVMVEEQGKPLRAARNEVKYAADFLLWFAEEAKRVYGRTIPSARPDQRFIVDRRPIGVVGAITPWNYPISMITRKVAPAVAAGCTVVVKPAEATPLCAQAVFRVFAKAGFPAGVVNLVTALDPEPVGKVLVEDSRVKKITFTGSTEVGRRLYSRAALGIKRVSLELGGHAPFIVCGDADPVHAAKGLVLVKYLNTGQACISPNRIYVQQEMIGPFVAELEKRVGSMRAGSGFDEGVSIGPLVNEKALEKVKSQVDDAVAKGASVICGGSRIMEKGLDRGFFYAPTVLLNVTAEMKIYSEETFGPVAPVIVYDKEEDLLEMANDTSYGLAAYVYTNNLKKAFAMFEGLRFGIIGINDINPTSAAAPFGGMKESGVGREGAMEGIEEYLETKLGGFSI